MTSAPSSSARSIPPAMPPVAEPTQHDFDAFRALILRHAGIHLNDSKKALLYGRLAKRVRDLSLSSFAEYYRRASDDPQELVHLLDRITTNETHFFREPHQFDFLERVYLPELVATAETEGRPRHVRVWSAACSTGEEPYSIAMMLQDRLPADGWSGSILATDLSTRVLDVARRATWPMTRAPEIGDAYLRRFMMRGVGSQAGFFRASPTLREMVHVERLNLDQDAYPRQTFDLVFCRNVLIYFHPARRQRVLSLLADCVTPRGLLLVGHAESVQGLSDRLRCVSPTIYQRRSS